ncbi:MAG: glutamate 5-kinase [Candidatus Nanopelagicales bacterium]|jgi:glutamate 5-kinase|nr:glutamate 5-kinase [Candidatus Nanopelagicales bacterium]
MSQALRTQISKAKRIVVKVGSSSLTTAEGGIDTQRVNIIVDALAKHKNAGHEIVLVSSGAIAAGLSPLGLSARPKDLALQQAVASVGQGLLVHRYSESFGKHGITVGQVLLTAEDMSRRSHYRNAQRTFAKLLELGVIPIVNENDTVATDEIRVGDNDRLAGIVTHLINAEALVLISDVEGLMTAPPGDANSKLISEVKSFDDISDAQIGSALISGVGTGGMRTKVQAAQIATAGGVPTIVTSAINLNSVFDGKDVGTVFHPSKDKLSARALWLAHATDVRGSISIDQGAVIAVTEKRASLLLAGIKNIKGEFEVGDAVEIVSESGKVLGRGLVNFDSTELPNLIGKNTTKLLQEFGEGYDKEVIHRDDLVLIDELANKN